MENRVIILGARGSVPVSGERFQRFGCATTCFLVELGGDTVIVDAGTGILNLPQEVQAETELNLLLTHAHTDHLAGLAMCPYLFRPGATLHLYAEKRNGTSARTYVKRLFSPPLWPVGMEVLPGRIDFHAMPASFQLGAVHVETLEGMHPGGVSLLRLTGGGSCVVITTDCTITDEQMPVLADFAKDCDLLMCDGQYSDVEWEGRSDFGHSTWSAAAKLSRVSGAKETRIIHHDPMHTDDELEAAAAVLSRKYPNCGFAQEGEVIVL